MGESATQLLLLFLHFRSIDEFVAPSAWTARSIGDVLDIAYVECNLIRCKQNVDNDLVPKR